MPVRPTKEFSMSRKPLSIPLNGEPQGILVQEGAGFRFVAVRLEAFSLDGRAFPTVEAAERAIVEILEQDGGEAELDGLVA